MSDPTLLIFSPGRRRGRPRAEEPKSAVSAWIPTAVHDAIVRLANEKSVSVSAFVGGVLEKAARKP